MCSFLLPAACPADARLTGLAEEAAIVTHPVLAAGVCVSAGVHDSEQFEPAGCVSGSHIHSSCGEAVNEAGQPAERCGRNEAAADGSVGTTAVACDCRRVAWV